MRKPVSILAITVAAIQCAHAQSNPSFDCRKAESPVEKVICRDPKLGALDRKVAAEYAGALKRLDGIAAEALRADQRMFQGILSFGMEQNAGAPASKQLFDLGDTLKERAQFLRSIIAPTPGRWAGTWSNSFGEIVITEKAGTYEVSASGARPITASWVCMIGGQAKIDGDRLTLQGNSSTMDADWTYSVARDGDRIVFSQHDKDGVTTGSPTCGLNGSLAGSYFLGTKRAPDDTAGSAPAP